MKTVQNPSIQSSDYRDLPLAQLVESPTNPRKRYDETSLQELAESIRAQGVLAPLLVRQLEPKRFEIVAGSHLRRSSVRNTSRRIAQKPGSARANAHGTA